MENGIETEQGMVHLIVRNYIIEIFEEEHMFVVHVCLMITNVEK